MSPRYRRDDSYRYRGPKGRNGPVYYPPSRRWQWLRAAARATGWLALCLAIVGTALVVAITIVVLYATYGPT